MKFTIEKRIGDYDPEILLPIWQDGLVLDERRLDWSYRNNVNNTPTVYLVKNTTNNEYFGSLTIFPREYYLEQKKVMGGTAGDFCIKKTYRSLGPALALQKHALQNLNSDEVLLTFPNKASEKVAIRAGFRSIGYMIAYAKPLKASYVVKKMKKFTLLKYLTPFIYVFLRCRDFKAHRAKGVVLKNIVQEIDERFDWLWEDTKSRHSFIGDRSSKYLRWRFSANPYENYNAFIVEGEKEQLLGYLIYAVREQIVFIDDFLWNGSDRVFNDLLQNFTVLCRKAGYEAIHLVMFQNTTIGVLLKKNGFIKKNTGIKVLFTNSKPLNDATDNIFITKGDDDF